MGSRGKACPFFHHYLTENGAGNIAAEVQARLNCSCVSLFLLSLHVLGVIDLGSPGLTGGGSVAEFMISALKGKSWEGTPEKLLLCIT